MATIEQMLQMQYEQQESIMGLPKDPADRKALAKEICLYLNGELVQYLNTISYKRHLPKDDAPRSTRVIELIDIQKYVLCLFWLEQVDHGEFWQQFCDKTAVVQERFKTQQMGERVCGFDIDGVLSVPSPEYRSEMSEEEKEALFESGLAASCLPAPGAAETLRKLAADGWGIILVTSRKRWRHARLEAETYDWLHRYGMTFHKIFWSYDKGEAISKSKLPVAFFVEDSVKHGMDLAENGIKVMLLGHPEISHPNITNISSIEEVLTKLEA